MIHATRTGRRVSLGGSCAGRESSRSSRAREPEEERKPRDALKDNAEQLDKFPLPMATEPVSTSSPTTHGTLCDDIFFASIADLTKAHQEEFSAVELTRAFCDRLENLGPTYNALALPLQKEALRQAKNADGEIKRERYRARCKAFLSV